MNSTQPTPEPWYHQSAMLLCAGVLTTTLIVSSIMITLAVRIDDPLVIDEQSYQQLRDDFRLTEPRDRPLDERSD